MPILARIKLTLNDPMGSSRVSFDRAHVKV
jgi:hypothetical protein